LRGVLRKSVCHKLDSSFLFRSATGVFFWSWSHCLWNQNELSATTAPAGK